MFRRSVLAVAAVLAALAGLPPAPAGAGAFTGSEVQVGGCRTVAGDALTLADGSLAGFASCRDGATPTIRYFSRGPRGSVRASEPTWLAGHVLGMAADQTGTYALVATGADIRVGKRTPDGQTTYRVVDSWTGTRPTGDIVARNGHWFAVWSRQTGPGRRWAQTELFSAGSTLAARKVTDTARDIADDQPTLAYSGATPVLVWPRTKAPFRPGPTDLMSSKYVDGAWRFTRVFTSGGNHNVMPDLHIAGDRSYVAWVRDGFVRVAGNRGGGFVTHRFNTRGNFPRVATSTTDGRVDHVFVAWTTSGAGTAATAATSPRA